MTTLLKSKQTAVWLLLMAVTCLSWFLGANHAFLSDDANYEAAVLIIFAFFKVRLVVLYFMEVRDGPLTLRLGCEAWVFCSCLGLVALLLGLLKP